MRVGADGNVIWGPFPAPNPGISASYLPFLDKQRRLNIYVHATETLPPGQFQDRFLKINPNDGNVISEKEIEIGVGEFGFNPFNRFCANKDGSAIFVFNDFRADTLRAQKLDEDGNKLWGERPIIINMDELDSHGFFNIQCDSAGGACVWYITDKQDTIAHLVYINSTGTVRWRNESKVYNGILSPSVFFSQPITVAPNSDVFVFQDGFQSVFKLNANGGLIWSKQISRRSEIAAAIDQWISFADQAGGCTVVWVEVGPTVFDFHGIRGQRVDRYGNLGGTTAVEETSQSPIPEKLTLYVAGANPSQQVARIKFAVPRSGRVTLQIYNILGEEVQTLKDENLAAGSYLRESESFGHGFPHRSKISPTWKMKQRRGHWRFCQTIPIPSIRKRKFPISCRKRTM
jgi:hypothetical protein